MDFVPQGIPQILYERTRRFIYQDRVNLILAPSPPPPYTSMNFEGSTLLLLSSLFRLETFNLQGVTLALLSFLVVVVSPELVKYLKRWRDSSNIYKYQIQIIGFERMSSALTTYEYPHAILALSYHIFKRNLSNQYRVIDSRRNGVHDTWFFNELGTSSRPTYVLDDSHEIQVTSEIRLRIQKNEQSFQSSGTTGYTMYYHFILGSSTLKTAKLESFLLDCITEYENSVCETTKDKIYHFIYQSFDQENQRPRFSVDVLSNLKFASQQNFETFDHMIGPNKNILIHDIELLRDIQYYEKKGLRRKRGYLFYGPPGCGKTSHVMAMANFDNRHIIEIPLSRVKTAQQFESLLHIKEIEGIPITKDKVIYLFDELDLALEKIEEREAKETKGGMCLCESKKKDEDSVSLDVLLSRLDGIGSYQGMIVVATTNHKDKLPNALIRTGRLTPMEFTYVTREDICTMMNLQYHMTEPLSPRRIPSRTKITPCELTTILEQCKTMEEALARLVKN